MKRLLPILLGILLGTGAHAASGVTNAWIRLLPGDLPLAGYFTLHNDGARPLTIIGASSPEFAMVHLHRSFKASNGMEQMEPAGNIEVAAGGTFSAAPGGYHLMLMQRKHPLRVGQHVPIALKLAHGADIAIDFVVKDASGN